MSYPVLTGWAYKPVRTKMVVVDGSAPTRGGIAWVRAVVGALRQRRGAVIERVAGWRSVCNAAHVSTAETGFQKFKKATSVHELAGHARSGLFALAILAGAGLAAFSPGSVHAQARTIWGTGYTGTGPTPARGFSVTLPGVTASTTTTLSPCWITGPGGNATNISGAFTGTNSGTAGFYAPVIPGGTTGMGMQISGFSGVGGCTATSIPTGTTPATSTAYSSWTMAMNFSVPVDPRALRFHWMNLDSGTYQFSGVTPNRLAGSNVFTVNGAYVHPVGLTALNAGCQANNGTNPTGSCGSVNFSAATSTISSLSFATYDSDGTLGGGDGHSLALSLTQPSLLIRKQTTNAVGSNVFTFNYPANVVSNAAAGSTAATTENITVAANNAFVNGAQRFIANSGLNTTVTEPVPAGWVLTAASCYDVANANAVLVSLAAPVMGPANAALTIPTASITPTSQIQCDFTNNRQAPLQLAKAWAANSRNGDQVTIGATTGGANNTVSFGATAPTAANSGAAVFVNIGDVITLPAEAGTNAVNYTTALACSGGHTLSGSNGQQTNTLTITSANAAVCTYTNTLRTADLSITKTNTPAAGPSDQAGDSVVAGTDTTYRLVVTNNGATDVTGAVVRDTPQAGLNCPSGNAVTCSGAACPGTAITVGDLATGVTLGLLAAGASATLGFSCTVQ